MTKYKITFYKVTDKNKTTTTRSLRSAIKLSLHWLSMLHRTLPPASRYRLQKLEDGYGLCSVTHGCIATVTIQEIKNTFN